MTNKAKLEKTLEIVDVITEVVNAAYRVVNDHDVEDAFLICGNQCLLKLDESLDKLTALGWVR